MRIRYSLALAAMIVAACAPGSANADEDLSIVINPRTGAASIRNDTDASIDLDGYLLRSNGATFDPVGWNSLEEQGLTGWFDGPALASRLADTNLLGSSSLAAGATFDLGNPYTPFAPSAIGEVEPSLDFTYNVPGAGSFTGDVEFSLQNTVVLVVDPSTGDAVLENQSAFDVDIDAYLIKSTTSALSTTGWAPLQDSLGLGGGWGAAAGAANRLAEGNLLGSTMLAKDGGSLDLGSPIDTSVLDDESDLSLEFHVPGVGTIEGGVLFASSTVIDFLESDYNEDTNVDLLDLGILGTNFGATGVTKADGDGTGDGNVDLLDLGLLGTQFGMSSAAATSIAVPEPSTALLLAFGLVCGLKRSR